MDSLDETAADPGTPRSEADAAFLKRYDARMRLPIVVAAILPLIVVPQPGRWIGDVVGVLSWLVFLFDYIVHVRHLVRYRHTGYGRFDLLIVIATAPWFLLPAAQAGSFVVVLRLARVARLLVASRGSRRLLQRLGSVGLVAAGVVVVGSLVAYYAEHPTNQEFATVGDALWWGVVTLTTVGYGDIVPKTPTGRWAAVMIMVTGIAVLGVLSGSLASFFRLDPSSKEDAAGDGDDGPEPREAGPGDAEPSGEAGDSSLEEAITLLTAEVSALRQQVDTLVGRLGDRDDPERG